MQVVWQFYTNKHDLMSIYNDVEFVEVKNNNKKLRYIKSNHMNTADLKKFKKVIILELYTYTYKIECWMSLQVRAINVYRTPYRKEQKDDEWWWSTRNPT